MPFLESGLRMNCGRDWHRFLYAIMCQCWHGDPTRRPGFRDVARELAARARPRVSLEASQGEDAANAESLL